MAILTGVLSLVGLAAIGFMLYVLSELSARLGAVTKMPSRYRLFWVGGAGVALAAAGRLVAIAGLVDNNAPLVLLLLYLLPLGGGLTASLVAAWYYWRWLLRE